MKILEIFHKKIYKYVKILVKITKKVYTGNRCKTFYAIRNGLERNKRGS
jgi:hypothetical protein